MKEIPLTQGFVTQVDDDDYDFLMQWKWHIERGKRTIYVARTQYGNSERMTIKMHRLILHATSNVEVDHIDHNGLNNQKNNIRLCNRSQNLINKKYKNKSGYKGVIYSSRLIKGVRYTSIIARIHVNNKQEWIGSFKTEEEAAKAYDKAAIKYHGEFANLNFKDNYEKDNNKETE